MIAKDYILLILNCKKYKYKAELQKKVWLSSLPNTIQYYHIIGDSSICDDKEYNFDHSNNILYVNTPDDYMSLPHKIITAIKAINEVYNYKYIFKTDDDQFLIKDKFFETLINILINNKNDYGGFSLTVKDHISSYWTVHSFLPKDLFLKGTTYCNGRFYLLSKNLVNDLLKYKEQIKTHVMEDHAIGLHIENKYKSNIFKINTNAIFIDIEKYIENNFFIYTECVNCPEICTNAIISYFNHHNYKLNIILTENDLVYIKKYINNNNINYILLDNSIKQIYNENGHLGTSYIWCDIIEKYKNKKIIHIDSDIIIRGNIIDDIIYYLIDNDLVGPYRCYKNNLNNRNDLRDKPDVVSTYCFGFNPSKIDTFNKNIMIQMIRGFYNPLGFNVLDFFDPVSFNILKNNGKIKFIDFNIIGGLNFYGSKDNKFKILNNLFDVGEKIIHFSSVGSGINFKKAIKTNATIKVPESYVKHSFKTLAVYNYLLFNKIMDDLPEKYKNKNIKTDFEDLKLQKFIEFKV